ncbi:hypothetical protein THOM_1855 [Trachipleistophora hominis]|uniref:Uncharacterized protein n=1 Tax=Trachipleistophora hominis TaxID=72359 RepID=L7JWY2_TRAHO|nr:hypothetical protein THOM_1855 [Trachipleistophora hominis]
MFIERLYTFRHNHRINHVFESRKFILVADSTRVYFWDKKTKELRKTKTYNVEIFTIHKLMKVNYDILAKYIRCKNGENKRRKFIFQSFKRIFNDEISIKTKSLTKACFNGAVIIGNENRININGTSIKHKYGNIIGIQSLHGHFFASFEIGKICGIQKNYLYEILNIDDVPVSFSWDQNSFYCCTLSGFLYKMKFTASNFVNIAQAAQKIFEDKEITNIEMCDISREGITEQHYNMEELKIKTLMVLDKYTDIGRKIKKIITKDNTVIIHTVCDNLVFLNQNLEIEGFLENVDDVFDRKEGVFVVNGYDVTELEWGWK